MAEKTSTKVERTTEDKPDSATTQTPAAPAAPAAPTTDTPKRGSGSDTNPSGIGGNDQSVSG